MSVPGEPPYPLGVYDHAAPPEFSFVESHNLGHSVPVKVLRTATKAINDANDILNSLSPF